MPDRLLLRLDADGDATWLRQAADGRVASGVARGFPPASARGDGVEIVVLLPTEHVLLTEARIAAKNRAQLLQALPFAIEDQLLEPVEHLHFAAGNADGDRVGAAVVAKATLRRHLDRLADAGIRADVVLPESLALPVAENRATVAIEPTRAIARLAPFAAFACPPDDLDAWLARASASARAIDTADFREGASAKRAPMVAERPRDALVYFAQHLRKPALNFLHGEFAPSHRAARGAHWWRIAAMLAAATIALAVLDLGVDVVQMSRTSSRLEASSQDAVRKAFPDVGDADFARSLPADIARSRIERLRGGAETSGFLRVLTEIAPTLGATTTRIQTRGMEFRNGTFELALHAPDVAALDAVRERLAALPGLKVGVTAANPGDGGIDGRIRIGGDAGGAR
jgi:general secretion pathway protein L